MVRQACPPAGRLTMRGDDRLTMSATVPLTLSPSKGGNAGT